MRGIRGGLTACLTACLTAVLAAAFTLLPPPSDAAAFPARTRQDVIDYLRSITGTSVVSGQHNKEPAARPGQYTQQVHDITGQYPGLWGGDLMFTPQDVADRQRVVDQARTEWANGSLVSLTWHVCPPTGGSGCAFEGGVKSRIGADRFREVVTDGTALNAAWKRRLDEVVPYLRQLRDAGVPVLFRPLHEMNESWNWWGAFPGQDGGARLFRITRDHLTAQGLDNLIWVWNVQDNPAGGWAAYYPGDAYVDVVSLDVWYKAHPSQADYQQIQDIANGKPLAIGEMGRVPDAALLESQPRWAWFMIWSEQLRGGNSNAEIQAAYFHPRVLNQGETGPIPGGTRTGAIRGLAGKCVDARASGTADGTPVQLYTCSPGVAQTWTVGADGTIRNPHAGRCLDPAGGGTADGTPLQLGDCTGSDAQRWQSTPSTGALRNARSGRCLDVTDNSPADSTRLQLWDCTGAANQRWTLPV